MRTKSFGVRWLATAFRVTLDTHSASSCPTGHTRHLIALPPPKDGATSLRPLVTELHSKTARWINKLDKTPGRKVWHNYHDTILSFEKSYYARLKYVHHNAVHQKIALKAEDYLWCSASWFKQTAHPSFQKTIESFKTDRLNVSDDFQPILSKS